jgi:hypothetical protein
MAPINSMRLPIPLKDLLHGIAEGRRPYGPPVDKIFSFIDVNETVQLFYCQQPGEEQRVLSSPHARDLCVVYSEGNIGSVPGYLRRAFNKLRAEQAEEEANRFKILPPISLERLGEEIGHELKQRRWGEQESYDLEFNFEFPWETWMPSGKYDEKKSHERNEAMIGFQESVREKGYQSRRYSNEVSAGRKEQFDVAQLNGMGKELADESKLSRCELTWLRVTRTPPTLWRTRRIVLMILLLAIIVLGILVLLIYLR